MIESDEDLSEFSESNFDDSLGVTDLSSNSCQSENGRENIDSIANPTNLDQVRIIKKLQTPNICPRQTKRNKKNSTLYTDTKWA